MEERMELELILNAAVGFLTNLSVQFPVLVSVFAILYLVGLGFKLLREAFTKFVKESPSTKDDELLEKIEANKIFKAIAFVMDLLIRFKKV